MEENKEKTILDWALEYAAKGWHVFPLHAAKVEEGKATCSCGSASCTDQGKHPRGRRGLKEASNDQEKIKEWFDWNAPPSNIGIVTGKVSGITVIDIDTGEGKKGAETWAELIKEEGEPETLIARTGSGGMHLLFKYNSALKTSSNTLGSGIDVRNDGGYIVAAPSMHRCGVAYEWLNWEDPVGDLPANMTRRKETRGRPRKDDMYRSKYTLEQVFSMLEKIDPGDRDLWRSVGIVLGREFKCIDDAWKLYQTWSDKWGGTKGRNHNEIMHEAFYEISQQKGTGDGLTIGTIVRAAIEGGWVPSSGEVPCGHFVFYGPGNNYIYRPTTSFWIAAAVDSACSPVNEEGKIVRASEWLRLNALVTSMTTWPGFDEDVVKGVDCRNGDLIKIAGAATFNTYKKPNIELGDARLAGPFLEHARKIFNKPGDADQFLNYMAHRVQKPEEKPRFALLIAGDQGVGKDTAVEFCVPSIGSWNVANIDPSQLESGFNEYAASTLVRINEAANLHDMTRWAFNERTKVLIAGSPDDVMINPKYGQKYSVKMFCGVIITTNHLANGIYIPEGDRRYDVIAAATAQEMGLVDEETKRAYFGELWDWFLEGGSHHVAAYLATRDILGWSPNTGQRKTDAHRSVVVGGMAGDHWLVDALDEIAAALGVDPDAMSCARSDWILQAADRKGELKTHEIRNRLNNSMRRRGYSLFVDPASTDGRVRIGEKRHQVYVREGCSSIDAALLEREIF